MNLQNDNKLKASKKKSFFDVDYTCEECESVEIPKATSEKDVKEVIVRDKRFRRGSVIAIAVISVLLAVSIVISGIDFIIDGELNGVFKKDDVVIRYDIYDPDWETDIYTIPEYLELRPDEIVYSDDGGRTSATFEPEDIKQGSELWFLSSYFNALKQGDSERLNSLFSEEYIKENGKFGKFPMQKVYKIKIEKLPKYIDEKYENKVYDYCYYSLTYNIYRNDGYFCAEVDEYRAIEEGIMVVYDSNGNGRIEKRVDLR